MCRSVYIASVCALPLKAFDGNAPAFCVEALAVDALADDALSLPYRYQVGSHLGCGCGFENPVFEGVDVNDPDVKGAIASRTALVAYLTEQVARCRRLEMLTGWPGDKGAVTPLSGERTPLQVLELMDTKQSAMSRFWVVGD
jgi:hypothetical protein